MRRNINRSTEPIVQNTIPADQPPRFEPKEVSVRRARIGGLLGGLGSGSVPGVLSMEPLLFFKQ